MFSTELSPEFLPPGDCTQFTTTDFIQHAQHLANKYGQYWLTRQTRLACLKILRRSRDAFLPDVTPVYTTANKNLLLQILNCFIQEEIDELNQFYLFTEIELTIANKQLKHNHLHY